MRQLGFYFASAIIGSISLPLIVLLLRPEIIDPHYGPHPYYRIQEGEPGKQVQHTNFYSNVGGVTDVEIPPVDSDLLRLVRGLFAVQDYESLAAVVGRFDKRTKQQVLIYGINQEVRRLTPRRYQSESDPTQLAEEERAAAIEALSKYVETIPYAEVRAHGYLDIAPLHSDSQDLLRKALKSLESIPSVWKVMESQDVLEAESGQQRTTLVGPTTSTAMNAMSEQSDGVPRATAASSDSSSPLWWLASVGGVLGVAFMYCLSKFFELPLQNLGKAVFSQAFEASGFKNVAAAVKTGEAPSVDESHVGEEADLQAPK